MQAESGLSVAANCVIAGAALAGSVAAWFGFTTWWRQLQGQTEYDLARRVLRALYGLRNAVQVFRNPLIMQIAHPKGESSQYDTLLSRFQLLWDRIVEADTIFGVELLEAEVLWGANVRESTSGIYVCISKLLLDTRTFLEFHSGTGPTPSKKHYEDVHSTMFRSGDPDTFGETFSKAVTAVEDLVKGNDLTRVSGHASHRRDQTSFDAPLDLVVGLVVADGINQIFPLQFVGIPLGLRVGPRGFAGERLVLEGPDLSGRVAVH